MKKVIYILLALIVFTSANEFAFSQKKKKDKVKIDKKITPLVAYKIDSLWHFIGSDGKEMFAPQKLKSIRGYSEGFFPVTFDYKGRTRWGYLSDKGALNLMNADELRFFSDGIGMFIINKINEKNDTIPHFGFIDKNNNVISEPIWKDATDFTEGLAWVMNDSIRGYINKKGKFEYQFLEKGFGNNYFEGFAGYHNANGDFGFMDKSGKSVIKPQFDEVGNFVNSIAWVGLTGKYGYIDKSGKTIITPAYDFAMDFESDYTFVGNAVDTTYRAKWAIINKAGKKIVDFNYDNVRNFSEGLAAVSSENEYYFIDYLGNKIINKTYAYADSFKNGLAWVNDKQNGKKGFINPTGDMVFEIPNASIIVDLRFNRVLR